MSERLRKLLGMLGSDFDGERANAAKMIADMAKKEGKTVADFVMSPQIIYRDREKIVYRDPPPRRRTAESVFTEDFEFARKMHAEAERMKRREHPGKRADRPKGNNPLIGALIRARDEFWKDLTQWEKDFVTSILDEQWCTNDYDMSYDQQKAADRIRRKIIGWESEPLI